MGNASLVGVRTVPGPPGFRAPRRRDLLAAVLLFKPETFTGGLWRRIEPVYARTLAHPFLTGLTDGSLPRAKFQFYLAQDSLYLRAFGQALNLLAAKAPRPEWAVMLSQHSVEAVREEREMHRSILQSYGAQPVSKMAPTNLAYTNHLFASVLRNGYLQGLCALLPCYWIYWEVGKHLARKGSPDKDYERWIRQYSGGDYGKTVNEVLGMADEAAASAAAGERLHAAELFEQSARYEYLFWDMAWREETWAP
ncbi:MAG: TenA family protein [Bryobacterales bacterium]|nr:TenA family protein [Bryobacterales bacterium]